MSLRKQKEITMVENKGHLHLKPKIKTWDRRVWDTSLTFTQKGHLAKLWATNFASLKAKGMIYRPINKVLTAVFSITQW